MKTVYDGKWKKKTLETVEHCRLYYYISKLHNVIANSCEWCALSSLDIWYLFCNFNLFFPQIYNKMKLEKKLTFISILKS